MRRTRVKSKGGGRRAKRRTSRLSFPGRDFTHNLCRSSHLAGITNFGLEKAHTDMKGQIAKVNKDTRKIFSTRRFPVWGMYCTVLLSCAKSGRRNTLQRTSA